MPKKIKLSPPLSFKATNYKSLVLFESFVEKATFYSNNHEIMVNKVCAQAKDVKNLFSLLHTVAWQNLKHSDPPQIIPLEM
uniref:Uncharacterized protein n=1 Tax=Amphimedon queenslandica TaxID=400682 RepID=A0A1X7VI40_AMPQE